ncbi:MAG: alpha-hydroxy acid oxidase [Candidatus Kapaibacteriota bacterium]
MQTIVNLADIEREALTKLSANAREYYIGGAADEITVRQNQTAFQHIALLPRVLRNVAQRSLQTTLLGETFAMPIGIAPTAMQRLAHEDGEFATARAAASMSVPMILSTTATVAVEDVAKVAGVSLWFQVYVYKDREVTREIAQRAAQSGCKALVLTVDAPYLGKREREVRVGFHLPPNVDLPNYRQLGSTSVKAGVGESGLARHFLDNIDPALTWKDVEWLQAVSGLPVVVKGILRGDDAVLAQQHGAAGVIVSNHGGRQLDTAAATIDALAAITDALGGSIEVMLDGGIRRGTDVLKALALGARAVFLGRPILWGLSYDGEQGVQRVLEILRDEFDLAMALCGCRSVAEIDAGLVVV